MDEKAISNLKAEKNVFEIIAGEYVVKAFYSFVEHNCLFFVLDYMSGGDLDAVLNSYCRLSE